MPKLRSRLVRFVVRSGLPWLCKGRNRSIGAIELSYIREVGEDAEVIIERVAKSLAVVAASQVSRISCGN